jgi:O-antigen ligase
MQQQSPFRHEYISDIKRVIFICLLFIIAIIPLIINPFALDYWYKPKIDSIYALLIILGVIWGLQFLISKKSVNIKKNVLFLPLSFYALVSIISTWYSVNTKISIYGDIFREEGIYTILSYIALTVIFSIMVESEQQLLTLLRALLISATIISIYAIIQYLGYNPTEHFIPLFRGAENRAGSTIGNPTFLAKFLVLMLPLAIGYFLQAAQQKEKRLLLACILILFSGLMVTFTRASLVSFACSLGLLAALLKGTVLLPGKKQLRIIVVCILCIIMLVELQAMIRNKGMAGTSSPSITKKVQSLFKGELQARLYLWEKAIMVIKERPLLGYGLDNQGSALERFSLEYARTFNHAGVLDRAHNNYIDIALAQGLVGLAAYLWVILTFLHWLYKTTKAEKSTKQKIMYCGLLAAFCGYCINDFFTFSIVSVSPTFWSLMGLTLSMHRLKRHPAC